MRSIPVLVILALVLSGCPEKPPCNVSSCPDGCCTNDGQCLPGNDKKACGTGGLFCRACDDADTCANKRCDLVVPDAGSCPANFHRCGSTCASNDDVATCGTRCEACLGGANGTATCAAGRCGLACRPGFHQCGTACADDTSPNSCGDLCGPCSFPANSRPACTNQRCDFACDNGFHRCGDACLPDTAPESCGGRCMTCPAPSNGTATCVTSVTDAGNTNVCDFSCNPGFHRCGMSCLSDTAPESCGQSCTPCPGSPNGTPTCVNDACAFSCASGFNPCNGQCAPSTDVTACGAACTRCANGVPGSLPTCDGTTCATACAAGNTQCASGSCVGAGVAAACGSSCTICPPGSPTQRATCSSGACQLACIDSCNAACVDRQRDVANCGACGTTCGASQACIDGACRAACTNGLVFAGIAEVLPQTLVPGADSRHWAVDVTGDGRLDLLATSGTSRLTFTNAGNARFVQQASADAGTTLFPMGTADFVNDGRADLIAGDLRALWVVQQTSTGFSTPLVLFTNGQNGLTVPADFTGDGRIDLVRVPMLGNLNADLWVNASADGGAPFSQTRNAAPNLQQAEFARAGDFNNDSRSDLVTAHSGQLRVFLTSGANAFTLVTPAAPTVGSLVGLAAGEVTRDANRDVVVVTASAVSVLAGNGAGALAAPVLAGNAGSTIASVEVADLDGDGFNDIALGTGRGLEVLWSTGAGTFSALDVYEVDGFTSAAPAAQLQLVDLTGDGRLDAVVGNSLIRPTLLRNGPAGRGFERSAKTAVGNGTEFLLTARFDADQRVDLLLSRRATVSSMLPIATQTRVVRANGDGGFTVGPEDLLTKPEGVADFDADGEQDVLRLECPNPPLPDGGVNPTPMPCFARVDFGSGLRFGAASVTLALNELAPEVLLRTGDFDGDGAPDVVARTRLGFLLFRNTGSRQFAPAVVTPFLPTVVELLVFDGDRDGRADLAVLSNANAPRAAYVLFSRPPGFALGPKLPNVDFDTGLAAGFISNDGFPDLAGSTGALLAGSASGSFSRTADWRLSTLPSNASFTADTDGDGLAEIVSRQFSFSTLVSPTLPPRGFAGRVERFADVTGDGIPDWVQLSSTELVLGAGRCR